MFAEGCSIFARSLKFKQRRERNKEITVTNDIAPSPDTRTQHQPKTKKNDKPGR